MNQLHIGNIHKTKLLDESRSMLWGLERRESSCRGCTAIKAARRPVWGVVYFI